MHGLPEKRRLGLTWPHSNNVTAPAPHLARRSITFDRGTAAEIGLRRGRQLICINAATANQT
ncbi:hypothetical protein BAE36_22365 [Rhizobium leguminosarum bv. trifolii]|nr:hypothetical protein BAE36_28430 [Rhizobium leguminosarum bv. trifolii]OBY05032.1 hypothetical protein BAE36_22365 [Rhizobium leguminosarum bv. trifolii]